MPFSPYCDNAFGKLVQFSENREQLWFSECIMEKNYNKCRGRNCPDFEKR
ncbi:MAG: hypothetical protein O8C58_01070 [Candidatus Methanoperedens sp.]|nr:hypothetical protein [Candidatus Methanoperedens sp.]